MFLLKLFKIDWWEWSIELAVESLLIESLEVVVGDWSITITRD